MPHPRYPHPSTRLTSAVAAAVAALVLAGCAAVGPVSPDQAAAGSTAVGQPAPGQVRIQRDGHGIPHIYASTPFDLFYGYGVAVGQDRLYQMEMTRRAVLGQVAEVLGPDFAALDESSRRVSNPASIREQMAALPAADRAIFDGYAAGLNAWVDQVMADKAHKMPLQFIQAGFEPGRWTATDIAMIWVGTMANRYSNSNSELANLKLLQDLQAAKGEAAGRALFDQIRWISDPLAPTTVPGDAGQKAPSAQPVAHLATPAVPALPRLAAVSSTLTPPQDDLRAAWSGWATPHQRPIASNLWSFGRQRVKSEPGAAAETTGILMNGPQFSWFNPSYVYGVGLHGAGFDVVGNTPFAYPFVLFGTNGRIAWGATAGPNDVNDLYQVRLNPEKTTQYWYQGAWRDMTQRTETIAIKGQAAKTVDIYRTVQGTVTVRDTAKNTAYALRRSWEGHELQSLLAWIRSTQASSWGQWRDQAKKVAITINWYYLDQAGNTGYISPGFLPQRPASQDVRLPAVGDGSMEWLGIRPFDEVPQTYNPAQGYVVNWNNLPAPGALGDGNNYGPVDRVNELAARIGRQGRFDAAATNQLNREAAFADLNRRYYLPVIQQATAALPATDPARQAADLLTAWSGEATPAPDGRHYAEPASTLMRAFVAQITRQVLQPLLPEAVYARYTSDSYGYASATSPASLRPAESTKLIYNALLGAQAGVRQSVDLFQGQNPQTVVLASLRAAVATLSSQFGPDPRLWLTPLAPHVFATRNFIGAPQAGADERLTLPAYMNRGTENNRVLFTPNGVSLCNVAPPGQSGFVSPQGEKSPHYSDQMDTYRDFGCIEQPTTPGQVSARTRSTQTLTVPR